MPTFRHAASWAHCLLLGFCPLSSAPPYQSQHYSLQAVQAWWKSPCDHPAGLLCGTLCCSSNLTMRMAFLLSYHGIRPCSGQPARDMAGKSLLAASCLHLADGRACFATSAGSCGHPITLTGSIKQAQQDSHESRVLLGPHLYCAWLQVFTTPAWQ